MLYHGYIVVAAAFLHHVLFSGITFSYNILHTYIVDEFQTSATKSGLTGTIALTVYHISSLLTSSVYVKIGHRRAVILGAIISCAGLFASGFVPSVEFLWLSFGLFTAAGGSLVTLSSMNMAVVYYPGKYCKRVICIVLCGTSTGVMVLPIIIETLLKSYGLRTSLLVLVAPFLLVGILIAFIYRPPEDKSVKSTKEQVNENKEQIEKLQDPCRPANKSLKTQFLICVQIMSRLESWLIQIGFFITAITVTFTFVNMGSLMNSNGLDENQIAEILTLMGVSDLVARILLSASVSYLPITTTLVFSLTSFFIAIPIYLLTILETYSGMLAILMTISVGRTILYSLVLTVSVEVFGSSVAGQSIGIAFAVVGIGSVSSTFVSDVIYDVTGSYRSSIYVCVVLFCASGIVTLAVELKRFYTNRKRARMQYEKCLDKVETIL